MPHREEYANSLVAQSLNWLLGDVKVEAETKGRADRKLLDFYIRYPDNTRIIIEAKYDDREAAEKAAEKRLQLKNPPDIVGALSYSPHFEKDPAGALAAAAPVAFAFKGKAQAALAWQWREGSVYDLAQSLRRPRAIVSPQEDEIENAVSLIQGALAEFVGGFEHKPALRRAVADVLQTALSPDEKKSEEQLEEAARTGGLIIFGAFLFQFALAAKDRRVEQPTAFKTISQLAAHWQFILDEINYVAVFKIAKGVLDAGNVEMKDAQLLQNAARDVQGAARGGVDLMGRIYHTLLADAKTLAAFYTSIPAATMMAGLALAPDLDGDGDRWGDMDFIKKLRIADPACGSGTLLAAACWQVRDNFARAVFRRHVGQYGGAGALGEKTREVHRALMEGGVWGYDILETAAHLTATTLGMMSPEVDFKKAHIYRTIIGKTDAGAVAGSLEMLERNMPIFNRTKQVETKKKNETLPSVDLCIMNPPFVRGTTGNESFNFLPSKEQKEVHDRIRGLGKEYGFVTDKGQGPAFVALACQKNEQHPFIKPGGRLAVILPSAAAAATGPAWRKMRETVEKDFDLETVITSRDADRPNFSENTALQECILICRKRKRGETPKKKALFVSLHHNPRNNEEAMAATQAIRRAQNNDNEIGDLSAGGGLLDGKMGQYVRLPYYGKTAWRGGSFSDLYLAFAAESFSVTGSLKPFLPSGVFPLVQLDSISTIGSCRLDIYFNGTQTEIPRAKIAKNKTAYAGYYPSHHHKITGVKHSDIRQIAEKPQCYCLPLPGREGWIDNYYKKAGRIIIPQSFRFNTMRRLASLISKPVQASICWPVSLHNESEERLKALTLWLNSTPALFLIVHASSSTHGAKVKFSQKSASELPVLDLDKLKKPQLRKLAAAFDEVVKSEGLLPLPKMKTDPVRHKIDEAFCEVLGLGDLSPLRAALAAEPIITNKPIGQAGE